MSNFFVFTIKKMKSQATVKSAFGHALRTLDDGVPNADAEKTNKNVYNGVQYETQEQREMAYNELCGEYDKVLPEKRRKNAVYALDVLITASPEAMESKTKDEQKAYFNDAYEHACKHYGGEENVLLRTEEYDEKTPHCRLIIQPLVDGKLNANKFVGGTSHFMKEVQKRFNDEVGEKHGLDHGVVGSKAKQMSQKEWHGRRINLQEKEAKIEEEKKVVFNKEADMAGVKIRAGEINRDLRLKKEKAEKEASEAKLKAAAAESALKQSRDFVLKTKEKFGDLYKLTRSEISELVKLRNKQKNSGRGSR